MHQVFIDLLIKINLIIVLRKKTATKKFKFPGFLLIDDNGRFRFEYLSRFVDIEKFFMLKKIIDSS